MRLKHEKLCFENCLVAQRQVYGHLVTVEVGVERCTSERVELNSLTFDHLRLECLDTETVKCRGTVEQYWMSLHYIFEDVPDYRLTTVYNLLGRLDSLDNTALDELTDDEWLVEFGSHEFWKTALSHLEFRTYDDN